MSDVSNAVQVHISTVLSSLHLPTIDTGLAEQGKSDTYSQTVGKERPTKALDKYSVYISLATPSR